MLQVDVRFGGYFSPNFALQSLSVDVTGDFVIVGEHKADVEGQRAAGRAYVFITTEQTPVLTPEVTLAEVSELSVFSGLLVLFIAFMILPLSLRR